MNFLKIKLLVIAVIMFAASSAFASFSYDVTVDTSSLNGTGGYLYLSFNQNGGDTLASTALVQNFATDGTLGATAPGVFAGSGTYVTGTLPTVSFANTNAVNDYNQAITFGNSLSFNLVLNQTGSDAFAGSTFTLGLYQDALGMSPLKTADGTLATFYLNGDGTTTAPLVADIGTTATTTPIPAAAWLLGSGLMGLAGIRRRMTA